MRYIKQLDAIRAIAIVFVLCNHTLPKENFFFKLSNQVAAPDVFFALSGFLITAILFKNKNAFSNHTLSQATIFKSFFLKRVLRIFPAYYLAIFLDYLLQPGFAGHYRTYLNFTTNFSVYNSQSWGRMGHLWTMASEQQFYLFWPFIIMLTPRKWLLYVLVGFITLGIYSQNVLPEGDFRYVLPQTSFDALGIGALLAWVLIYQRHLFTKVYKGLCVLAVLSFITIVAQAVLDLNVLILHHRSLVSIIVVWLIAYFVTNEDKDGGRLGVLFNSRWLIQLGKISYGIYLYHLTVLYELYQPFQHLNQHLSFYQDVTNAHAFIMLECVVMVFVLAWTSWKYIELPIYSLSDRMIKKVKAEPEVAVENFQASVQPVVG